MQLVSQPTGCAKSLKPLKDLLRMHQKQDPALGIVSLILINYLNNAEH